MKTFIGLLFGFSLLVFSIQLNAQTDKKTILELFNGTWCSACPDAATTIENVLVSRPDVIPVALHFGDTDPMNTEESYQLAVTYSGASAPGCMIDRVKFPSSTVGIEIDENLINGYLDEREDDPIEVSISLSNASYNEITRELSVDVNATFLSTIELTLLNFNLWIVEGQIVSFDPAYDQAGPTGSISAYPHKYVLRKMLGDEWGTVGAVNVPTVNSGDSFSHTYTYTIPDEWDINQLKIIGIMQKSQSFQNYDQRPILNATSIQLNSLITSGIEENIESKELRVYPNPSSETVHIDFYIPQNGTYNLRIVDMLGKEVYSSSSYFYNKGWQNTSWNSATRKELGSGIYYISIVDDSGMISTSTFVKE